MRKTHLPLVTLLRRLHADYHTAERRLSFVTGSKSSELRRLERPLTALDHPRRLVTESTTAKRQAIRARLKTRFDEIQDEVRGLSNAFHMHPFPDSLAYVADRAGMSHGALARAVNAGLVTDDEIIAALHAVGRDSVDQLHATLVRQHPRVAVRCGCHPLIKRAWDDEQGVMWLMCGASKIAEPQAAVRTSETASTTPAPVPAANVTIPKNQLSNWASIMSTIGKDNDRETRDFVRKLNRENAGPIQMPKQGGQPNVDAQRLVEWWNGNQRAYEESVARQMSIQASVADTFAYGRDGLVVPGIAGHHKHRRSVG